MGHPTFSSGIFKVRFILCSSLIFIIFCIGCRPIEIGQSTEELESKIPPVNKSGELTADEVWSGNIIVQGDVIVPKNITLTIDKGTRAKFSKGSKLLIEGSLYVEGQINNPIHLSSGEPQQKPGDWNGIIFTESSSNAKIQYCVIDFHTQILCQSDSINIANSVIAEGSIAGITCISSSPTIEDSMITRNLVGILCERSASPNINHNAITANITNGIECKTSSFPKITNSVISNNRKDGISCYSASSPEIESNNIIFNGGWAVYGGGKMKGNFIQGNRERGMETIDAGQSFSSDQFYGVESVESPRSTRVIDAGVRREERW